VPGTLHDIANNVKYYNRLWPNLGLSFRPGSGPEIDRRNDPGVSRRPEPGRRLIVLGFAGAEHVLDVRAATHEDQIEAGLAFEDVGAARSSAGTVVAAIAGARSAPTSRVPLGDQKRSCQRTVTAGSG